MPTTNDLSAVRAILETDRGWAAFALADLAPEYRPHSEWHIAADGRPALLLVYRAFRPPVLFTLGTAQSVTALLAEVAGEAELYLAVPPDIPDLVRGLGYEVQGQKPMLRMVLDAGRFVPAPAGGIVRLEPADEDALRRLYADGEPAGEAPGFFSSSMLGHGVYFGVREGGVLVAAAGTHVLAPQEGVAGIGNVYTRRDRRRRGFGLRVTAAVTAELLRLGVQTVALNVEARNTGAIGVYERLGFARHCQYCEGTASARETPRTASRPGQRIG